MKRLCLVALPVGLFACSGSSTLKLSLNSDDTASALTTPQLPSTGGATTLSGVTAVRVTVTEVDVHVSGSGTEHEGAVDGGSPDDNSGAEVEDARGEDVGDHDSGWQVVSTHPQSFDLMSLRTNATAPLGDATVPAGKLTQIRLKLQADATGSGEARIAGAVTDANGDTCDLLVPESAVNPGVKIIGLFQTGHLAAGQTYDATVNLRLSDSSRTSDATCTFRLNPVIQLKHLQREAGPSSNHP